MSWQAVHKQLQIRSVNVREGWISALPYRLFPSQISQKWLFFSDIFVIKHDFWLFFTEVFYIGDYFVAIPICGSFPVILMKF